MESVPLRVNPIVGGALAAAAQLTEGGLDPFVFFVVLIRVLGCLGHFALALSYAGLFGRWVEEPAFLALALVEALDRFLRPD